MFIPLKMVLIGIDPYPYNYTVVQQSSVHHDHHVISSWCILVLNREVLAGHVRTILCSLSTCLHGGSECCHIDLIRLWLHNFKPESRGFYGCLIIEIWKSACQTSWCKMMQEWTMLDAGCSVSQHSLLKLQEIRTCSPAAFKQIPPCSKHVLEIL